MLGHDVRSATSPAEGRTRGTQALGTRAAAPGTRQTICVTLDLYVAGLRNAVDSLVVLEGVIDSEAVHEQSSQNDHWKMSVEPMIQEILGCWRDGFTLPEAALNSIRRMIEVEHA